MSVLKFIIFINLHEECQQSISILNKSFYHYINSTKYASDMTATPSLPTMDVHKYIYMLMLMKLMKII
jgi:hypothetical protein